jgi:hypothetical protein
MFGMGNSTIGPGQGTLIALAAAAQYAIGQRAFSGNRAAQQASMFGLLPGAIVNLLTGGSRENQNFRFLQGTGGEGLFGGIGAEGTYGFDLRSLRQLTGGLDTRILKLLGGDASSGTAALAAYTQAGRRADGQPAQFAFPEGDQTAAEQIAKELLQSRYGTLFELIDKSFAEQIKGWAGTSTELQSFIESALGLFESISGSSIKGLNIDSLRAMAREGEALGDTMNRVAGDMAGLNSLFVDENQAYLDALRMVNDEFAALGVSMPATADSFKILRDSIDLSSESGRAMYDMLVRVAPAMQQIDQATRNMMNGFNAAMGQIFGSGYTKQMIEMQAIGLVTRFQSASGLLQGIDPLSVFKSLAGQNPADIQHIMNSYGPEVQTLLTQILQLYTQYMNVQEKVNDSTGSLGQVIGGVVDQFADARLNLQKYLSGSLLNQQLSPLTLTQQKDFALQEFERLAKLAPGSVDAMNQLGGARDAYLSLLRQLEGSGSGYNAEFFRTFDVTRGIAGGGPTWQSLMQSALPSQGARMASDQDVAALRQDIQQLTLALLQGDRETAERIADALEQQTEKLQQSAYQGGPMGITT